MRTVRYTLMNLTIIVAIVGLFYANWSVGQTPEGFSTGVSLVNENDVPEGVDVETFIRDSFSAGYLHHGDRETFEVGVVDDVTELYDYAVTVRDSSNCMTFRVNDNKAYTAVPCHVFRSGQREANNLNEARTLRGY